IVCVSRRRRPRTRLQGTDILCVGNAALPVVSFWVIARGLLVGRMGQTDRSERGGSTRLYSAGAEPRIGPAPHESRQGPESLRDHLTWVDTTVGGSLDAGPLQGCMCDQSFGAVQTEEGCRRRE